MSSSARILPNSWIQEASFFFFFLRSKCKRLLIIVYFIGFFVVVCLLFFLTFEGRVERNEQEQCLSGTSIQLYTRCMVNTGTSNVRYRLFIFLLRYSCFKMLYQNDSIIHLYTFFFFFKI